MQLKGVNNQESLQRQRSAVVQHVHAQLFASSFTWFSGMEIFLHAALSIPQGSFSHIFFFSHFMVLSPLIFFSVMGACFCFVFVWGSWLCWNTFRKHNINLVISWICVFCPSCSRNVGFRHLLRHKRLRNQHWKGREEKVRKCFKNYNREWRLCHCTTHGGIIPSKGWLPKMEAGILQAPNLH